MHKVQWIAGLSNGETAHEEKGNFQTIAGELSPWQRLLRYLDEKDLTITSLSLGTNDGRRWMLPSAGRNPKFQMLATADIPSGYKMFRAAAKEAATVEGMQDAPVSDHYTVAEAQFGNGKRLQVWVCEKTLQSWSVIM